MSDGLEICGWVLVSYHVVTTAVVQKVERPEAGRIQDVRQDPSHRDPSFDGFLLSLRERGWRHIDRGYVKSVSRQKDGVSSRTAAQVHSPAFGYRALVHDFL